MSLVDRVGERWLRLKEWALERKKALVPVATTLGTVVSLNVLPENLQKYAVVALAVFTAIGVHQVTNVQPVPDVDENDLVVDLQDDEVGDEG